MQKFRSRELFKTSPFDLVHSASRWLPPFGTEILSQVLEKSAFGLSSSRRMAWAEAEATRVRIAIAWGSCIFSGRLWIVVDIGKRCAEYTERFLEFLFMLFMLQLLPICSHWLVALLLEVFVLLFFVSGACSLEHEWYILVLHIGTKSLKLFQVTPSDEWEQKL